MNNYLLDQAQEADQIRGRENQLRVNYRSGHMLYKAPNKVIIRFTIAPSMAVVNKLTLKLQQFQIYDKFSFKNKKITFCC